MILKTRRILFYILFFLFIIASLIAVFYSYGWRIILENYSVKIQKTGGIFVETKPKDVVIKINNKIFKDKSGLLQNGTLIKNLLPKKYNIKIEKQGYLTYQKDIKIEQNLVSEIPDTVLIPEKFETKIIQNSKPIDKFWISSRQKFVFKNNGTLYYLKDYAPLKLRGDEFVSWSEKGDKFISYDSKKQIYYLYDINDFSKFVNISAAFNNLDKNAVINEIIFHPADSNKFIIKNDKNVVYVLDLSMLTLEILIKSPIISWTIKNPNIYYIAKNSEYYYLNSFNLILKTDRLISRLPDYLIVQFPFAISPDAKKIAFFDNRKLNIYFLEDYRLGINKKAEDIINLDIYQNQKIRNVFWFKDSYHLLTEIANPLLSDFSSVDFIEIDNRLPINKYLLVEKISDFYYDSKINRLYFLKDKILYFFDLE